MPILNRNPCKTLSSRIEAAGLNAATPGVEDTRNSQRTHPTRRYFAPPCPPLFPPLPSLYFFLPPVPSPPSLLLHFLPPTTTYNQQQQQQQQHRERGREREREKGREMKRVRDGCRKGVWARAGDNFIALVSSARLHRAEELPRATLRDHWRIIVREKGMGHPLFLPLPPLFLFLC